MVFSEKFNMKIVVAVEKIFPAVSTFFMAVKRGK